MCFFTTGGSTGDHFPVSYYIILFIYLLIHLFIRNTLFIIYYAEVIPPSDAKVIPPSDAEVIPSSDAEEVESDVEDNSQQENQVQKGHE